MSAGATAAYENKFVFKRQNLAAVDSHGVGDFSFSGDFSGGAEKLVSLSPGDLTYQGPEELTQYYVKNFMIGETMLDDIKVLRVSITLGRRLLGTILTVYLPTVLLNIIGHATNFFKPFFFEAVVTVNLTGVKHSSNGKANSSK